MSRHLSDILRLMATLPPSKRHMGRRNLTSASAPPSRTDATEQSAGDVPTLRRSASPSASGVTRAASPPADPTAESNRLTRSLARSEFSGSVPGRPTTDPMNESPPVIAGSSFVPIATRPPGRTSSTIPAPVPSETISVDTGSYALRRSLRMPGRISTSSPALNEPWTSDPPTTPPLMSGIGVLGRFTSNERRTCITGSDAPSRSGVGIDSSMARTSASVFSPACAETGTTGDFAMPSPAPSRNLAISP